MLKCVICSFYSHGESYDNNDPKCSHVCVKCASKTGKVCTSEKILKNSNQNGRNWFLNSCRNLQMSTTIINWWLVRLNFGLPDRTHTSSKLEQQYQFRVVAAILKLNGFSKSKNKKMSKQHLRICKSLDVKNSWEPQFLIKFP